MSQPTPLVVHQLRNLTHRAEALADEALIAKCELMSQILRARQSENVPAPHVGQDGIIRLSRAIQRDVSSQADLFRTHNALTTACHEVFADLPHDDTPEYTEEATAAAAA